MSTGDSGLDQTPSVLEHSARCLFELSPAVMMIVAVADGRIVELNGAGLRLFGAAERAGDLHVVGSGLDDGELSLVVNSEQRKLPLRCSPLPDNANFFVAAIADELSPAFGLEHPVEHVLPSIGAVTDRILHDVRNLIFPLVCHMDLAMASVDTNTEAFSSLLEVQASCRRCENELEKFSALSSSRPQPMRFVHAEDILERASLLLRYVLPKRVNIDVEVECDTKLIRVSPTEFQRLLVDIVSLSHARNEQLESLQLHAINDQQDVLIHLDLVAPFRSSNESYLREQERIRELLTSRISQDDIDIDIDVAVTPTRLQFEIRIHERATASTKQLENRNTADGQGELVAILHHQPMMRDLLQNYLRTKSYQSQAFSKLDELLNAIEEGVDAVVADISTDEARQLADVIAKPRNRAQPVVVLCRGSLDDERVLQERRLEHPFRMDEVVTAVRELLDQQ